MNVLSNEEKQKLREEIKELKSKISSDRTVLNSLKTEKEQAFAEKENLKTSLKELIEKVKSLRGVSEDKSLSELKKERDQYNSKVKEIIEKIKELRKDVVASGGKSVSIGKIKSDIDRLEESIEIEAFEYKQEQKVLDRIKKLKKVYEEHAKSSEVSNQIHELAVQLEQLKKHANESHAKFKEKLDSGKDSLKDYRNTSREILKVKKQQEKAWELFIEKKNLFMKANNAMKEDLEKLHALEVKLNEEFVENKKVKEVKKKEALEERTRSVEEKLKRSGKITTDDLALLQDED